MTQLARVAMHKPFIREIVRPRRRRSPAAGTLHTWNDLLCDLPGPDRRQDGPHRRRRLVGGRGRPRRRRHDLRDAARRAERARGATPTSPQLLAWGLSRYRTVRAIDGGRVYATCARAVRASEPLALVAAKPALRVVRVDRPLVERVVAPDRWSRSRSRKGQRLGEVRVLRPAARLIARSPLVAANARSRSRVPSDA